METNNKLREALDEILEKIDKWRTDGTMEHWQYSQLFDIADTALAATPRNCDVGTAREQAKRFFAFCDSNKCPSCPCRFTQKTDCALTWAQKPYEGGDK